MDFDRTATTKADVVRAVTTGKATTASIDFSETIVRVYLSPARKTRYTIIEVQLSEGSGETKRFEQKLGITRQGVEITIFETPKQQLEFRSGRRRAYARLSGRGLTRGSRVIAFCSVADEWGVSAHPGGPCVPTANSPVSLRVRSAAFSRLPRGTRL